MKTYEEMTRSVLEKGEKCRARRKKKWMYGASLAAMLCLILSAGFLYGGKNETLPTEQTIDLKQGVSRLQVFYAGNAEQKEMVEDVEAPLDFLIRVRDIRKVRNAERRAEIMEEEKQINQKAVASATGPQGEKGSTCWGSENSIVSLVQNEFLYIAVSDFAQVLDMSVETTEAGCATVVPYPYEKIGPDGSVREIDTGIHINWSLSDTTINRIDENPDMRLSAICDTVTVTVDFKDGTSETVVIDLTVDDAGQIHVTHKDTTIS